MKRTTFSSLSQDSARSARIRSLSEEGRNDLQRQFERRMAPLSEVSEEEANASLLRRGYGAWRLSRNAHDYQDGVVVYQARLREESGYCHFCLSHFCPGPEYCD